MSQPALPLNVKPYILLSNHFQAVAVYLLDHYTNYYFYVSGYRCFKAIMFLTGFIFGSIIVYLICLQEKLLPNYGNAGE